ncbi:MAG: VRR-NUC domain-containing protein [Anaerolineales bacterium]|nr:VRR-NUC domain-containing protein [Anaerolineales bacterium]
MTQRQATYKLARVSEHEEQANFFSTALFTYQHRDDFVRKLLFSVPNGMWIGGKNPYALMNKFKAEGLQPGVADILYLQPRGEYNCLAIEMKAQDKRNDKDAVKPEQAEFLEAVNASGGMGEVCYGCDEALRVFEAYMQMEAR